MNDASPARPRAISQRLIRYTLIVIVLLSVLSLAISTYAGWQVSRRLILQRNAALTETAASGVARSLDMYLHPLETIASAIGPLADLPAQQAAALAAWEPLLSEFEGGVALLDAHGVAIATTSGHSERLGLDYSFRAYFQQARETQQSVFSTVLQEQPSGRPAIVIATPTLDSAGRFAGAVIGVRFLDPAGWSADLAALRSSGGLAYLIDRDGAIIYHPDPALQGGQIVSDAPLWHMVLAQQSASQLWRNPAGEWVVTSFAPLPDVGWGLVLEEPWSQVLALAWPYLLAVAVCIIAGMVLSLLLMRFSVQRITQPLNALVDEARRISASDTVRPLNAQGPEELHSLIQVYNATVERLHSQQATLHHYAIQVIQGQEEERKRLSRELHDETVQELIGLSQRVELARRELDRDPSAVRRRLDELVALLSQAIAGVRRQSNDLRPLMLEDLGLSAAVQTLCDDLAVAMPAARVHGEVVGSERRLPPEHELIVFRVMQESLNNIRKHASSATLVNVTLYFEHWGILATVEDNGEGFDVPDMHALVRAGHLGLAGMQERAQIAGGELRIDSAPGVGTTVALSLPSF